MSERTIADGLIIFATLMGPVLAVQAQKWIERVRERRQRRLALFQSLMATRAARTTPEHVRALNMIDIEFYPRWWRPKEKEVVESWRIYQDHLNQQVEEPIALQAWSQRGDELFTDLLFSMSRALGYDFDTVRLKRGAYYPKAHAQLEAAQLEVRDNLVKILKGEQAIHVKMDEQDEARK